MQIIATSAVLAAAAVLAVAADNQAVDQHPTSLVFFENDESGTGMCVDARSEDVRAALEDASGALLVDVGGGTYVKKDQVVAVTRFELRDCD